MIALGTASCTAQQASGQFLIGGGENAEVVYGPLSRNVVGDGIATISGGGDNLQISYGPKPKTEASPGLAAELVGGGENAQIVYHQAAPATSMLAGQPSPHSD